LQPWQRDRLQECLLERQLERQLDLQLEHELEHEHEQEQRRPKSGASPPAVIAAINTIPYILTTSKNRDGPRPPEMTLSPRGLTTHLSAPGSCLHPLPAETRNNPSRDPPGGP
jgi:hypothetical protein